MAHDQKGLYGAESPSSSSFSSSSSPTCSNRPESTGPCPSPDHPSPSSSSQHPGQKQSLGKKGFFTSKFKHKEALGKKEMQHVPNYVPITMLPLSPSMRRASALVIPRGNGTDRRMDPSPSSSVSSIRVEEVTEDAPTHRSTLKKPSMITPTLATPVIHPVRTGSSLGSCFSGSSSSSSSMIKESKPSLSIHFPPPPTRMARHENRSSREAYQTAPMGSSASVRPISCQDPRPSSHLASEILEGRDESFMTQLEIEMLRTRRQIQALREDLFQYRRIHARCHRRRLRVHRSRLRLRRRPPPPPPSPPHLSSIPLPSFYLSSSQSHEEDQVEMESIEREDSPRPSSFSLEVEQEQERTGVLRFHEPPRSPSPQLSPRSPIQAFPSHGGQGTVPCLDGQEHAWKQMRPSIVRVLRLFLFPPSSSGPIQGSRFSKAAMDQRRSAKFRCQRCHATREVF
ncbi:MAG: hypothetical protein DHS80DRAFT_30467 [Piptocephalis tieghemiana]|nr:MAG: hypothetical protein DHS80DRAFT_30467 [Piptocephalis tieghemiana]